MTRPNVLVVVLDTARADAFEPYGAPSGASPAMAQLASDGAAAAQAYSTCNWTMPSHASLFTGMLPRAIGLGEGVAPISAIAPWKDRLLPEVFRRAGYETFGVSANPWISKAHGFDIGFDRFELVRGGRRAFGRSPVERARWWVHAIRSRADSGLQTTEALLDGWLRSRAKKPFFAFVNLMECHSPYLPPRPYNDLGVLGSFASARDVRRFQTERGFYEVTLGDRTAPESSFERMRHLYAASIRMMDDWIARLRTSLHEAGVEQETQILVTADHGENLGDDGMLGHVVCLADRLIRVPLITAGPVRVDLEGVTSHADVPAMLASVAGLDDHPWTTGEGRTVAVAQDDGLQTMTDASARALMAAWSLPSHIEGMIRMPRDCATDGRFKLVRVGEEKVLIDTSSDPLEKTDVSAGNPDVVARLTESLDAARVYDPPLTSVQTAAPTAAEAADLEERMRLLGYL